MFSYFKPKLIQFKNGKFGIIKHTIIGTKYLGNDRTWRSVDEYVGKYCQFNSADDAMDAFAHERALWTKSNYKVISDIDEWDV